MNPVERVIYRRSLEPKIENVKPDELRGWLKEIEGSWKKIPEFEVPEKRLNSLTIICDGNRRAAQAKGLDPFFGHRAGVEVIKGIARAARKWDIKYLTFWTWSTENWQREERQVRYVMGLATRVLSDSEFKEELVKNEVHFVHLGRKDRLPKPVIKALRELEGATNQFNRYWLNLAMDYGGLDEAARAMVEIIRQAKEGKLDSKTIEQNPDLILNFLDTKGQPRPDLVIRTGVKEGEIPHTSGLMPLQSAYACWDFVPELFPDLTPQVLLASTQKFVEYQRRFGR